jgi:hypothetical protein
MRAGQRLAGNCSHAGVTSQLRISSLTPSQPIRKAHPPYSCTTRFRVQNLTGSGAPSLTPAAEQHARRVRALHLDSAELIGQRFNLTQIRDRGIAGVILP